MRTILVTGAQGGLGRELSKMCCCIELHRNNQREIFAQLQDTGIETIVHCAYNRSSPTNPEQLKNYIKDNLYLTDELLSLQHKHFIYISSTDVYAAGPVLHNEREVINPGRARSLYAYFKILNEALVKRKTKNSLILRPTSILSPGMKTNNLVNLLRQDTPQLTLTPNSSWNFVLSSEVARFILKTIHRRITGKINLARSKGVSVQQVAKILGKSPIYGDFFYEVGRINNENATSIDPSFSGTSEEALGLFIREGLI